MILKGDNSTRNLNPPSGFHTVEIDEKPCELKDITLKVEQRIIDAIFIHCTASPDDLDVGVEDIRAWHLERGWNDIGYHFVVRRSGSIEVGRPVENPGAHVFGHNNNSIGIVWVGQDDPSQAQMLQLEALTAHACFLNALTHHHVHGHYEIDSSKTCPNIDMDVFRQRIRKKLETK